MPVTKIIQIQITYLHTIHWLDSVYMANIRDKWTGSDCLMLYIKEYIIFTRILFLTDQSQERCSLNEEVAIEKLRFYDESASAEYTKPLLMPSTAMCVHKYKLTSYIVIYLWMWTHAEEIPTSLYTNVGPLETE